jgi:phosphomevalonate kinase
LKTSCVARAPGKLVVLGEYAVLHGVPALVLAVDRNAQASVAPSEEALCELEVRAPAPRRSTFAVGAQSGVALVDLVCAEIGRPPKLGAWRATVDTAAFFSGETKLGLGSSAAALCVWAGAWSRYLRRVGHDFPEATLEQLIALHRALQDGGSGIDIAASFTGGVIEFQLDPSASMPRIGSVRLPNSVGFAGIFAGRSASTPELLARYRTFRAERPTAATAVLDRLRAIAEAGIAAARGDDADAFTAAIREYGRALGDLGIAIGAEIVTAEHRRIGLEAERHGVAYKVSGAGGGDVGIACAADAAALAGFKNAVSSDFRVVDLRVAPRGLVVEERES